MRSLPASYRRGYEDGNPLPDGSTRRVASYQVWDAQLGYAFTRDVRLRLDVHNLLDKDPPFTNSAQSFQVGYDPGYADPLGRTWTVSLTAAFR